MKLWDRIYGKVKIESPVLIELIKSKPLIRLKGIAQFGLPDKYYHLKNYSRFEHSIGVMTLLNKLGASEEEQIAGLLHDVSHSAFSHVIDWVVGDGLSENFQDIKHKDFILSSEISKILKLYGYSPDKIAQYENFSLLEQKIPNLCADRVDYSLREFKRKVAKKCFKDLTVKDGKMVYKTISSAKVFAIYFLKKQEEHWGGFEAVSRYRVFADILRYALEKKIIKFKDFWMDDEYVLEKLKRSGNEKIIKVLKALENKSLSNYPKSTRVCNKKFRHVDPLIFKDGKVVRLSKVDKKFKMLLEKAREENKKGIRIPLLK